MHFKPHYYSLGQFQRLGQDEAKLRNILNKQREYQQQLSNESDASPPISAVLYEENSLTTVNGE